MIVYKLSSGKQEERRPGGRVGLMGSVSARYLALLRYSRQHMAMLPTKGKRTAPQDDTQSARHG